MTLPSSLAGGGGSLRLRRMVAALGWALALDLALALAFLGAFVLALRLGLGLGLDSGSGLGLLKKAGRIRRRRATGAACTGLHGTTRPGCSGAAAPPPDAVATGRESDTRLGCEHPRSEV